MSYTIIAQITVDGYSIYLYNKDGEYIVGDSSGKILSMDSKQKYALQSFDDHARIILRNKMLDYDYETA